MASANSTKGKRPAKPYDEQLQHARCYVTSASCPEADYGIAKT